MEMIKFIPKLIGAIFIMIYKTLQAMVMFCVPNKFKYVSVENKLILITGAASGVGAALAVKFARRHAHLVLWDLNQEGLSRTMDACRQYQSEKCMASFAVDITNRQQVLDVAAKVKSSMGPVDILINNAGIVSGKHLLEVDEATVRKVLDVNVVSHFWTVQAFLPDMLERNSGHIVSLASLAGLFGAKKLADYCASKFASIGFQETLLNEVRCTEKNNVHVTTVCPFYINTGMFDGIVSECPLLPIMELDYVVTKIEEAILLRVKMVIIPRLGYLLYYLKSLLPVDATLVLIDVTKVNQTMDFFRGRKQAQSNSF